ncbi:hypothetical protein MHEI_34180 [Mycobacterium heidelbergense]|nr:hypothetical protein MHEI_34180 [Mycobacterium heidelbergense]
MTVPPAPEKYAAARTRPSGLDYYRKGPQYYDAMRTTLQIDDDILEDARSIARSEGRSVGAVISDLARRSLRPVGIVVVDGLPMFDVPPDAPIIADEDVARGLEEDV